MEIVRRGLDVLSIEEKPERNAWASLAASCRGRRLIQTAKRVCITHLVDVALMAGPRFDRATALIGRSWLRPIYLTIKLPEQDDDQLRRNLRPAIQAIDCSRLADLVWSDRIYEFCLPILMAGAHTLRVLELKVYPNAQYPRQSIDPPTFTGLEVIILCPEIPFNALQAALLRAAIHGDVAIVSGTDASECEEEENQETESE